MNRVQTSGKVLKMKLKQYILLTVSAETLFKYNSISFWIVFGRMEYWVCKLVT